jgi:hypothetical protein
MDKLEISNELDIAGGYFEKRIKKLRALRKKAESLEDKIHFEKKITVAQQVQRAFRKMRFDLEDEAANSN